MTAGRSPERNTLLFVVALLAFSGMLFELAVSRLAVFFISYINSLLAVPLTLVGLAVGGFWEHLRTIGGKEFDLGKSTRDTAIATAVAMVGGIFIFGIVLGVQIMAHYDSQFKIGRTVVFVLIFFSPFVFLGRTLAGLFWANGEKIGRLYGCDLLGASLACFLTPLLLHYSDMPILIGLGIGATQLAAALSGPSRIRNYLVGAGIVLLGTIAIVNMEGNYKLTRSASCPEGATQIAHKWNEYSRVTFFDDCGSRNLVHDNGSSHVGLGFYEPSRKRQPADKSSYGIPAVLGRPYDSVLVMFAGAGNQMIPLHEVGAGKERFVGVEINPTIVRFATELEELSKHRLAEFFSLPNVSLVAAEGRSYLEREQGKFDLIFVSSGQAPPQFLRGDTAKYLHTLEAIQLFLDRLEDDGLVIFSPGWIVRSELIASLASSGVNEPEKYIAFVNGARTPNVVVISKRPFSDHDLSKLASHFPDAAVGRQEQTGGWQTPVFLKTDDRPYPYPTKVSIRELFRMPTGPGGVTSWFHEGRVLAYTLPLLAILILPMLVLTFVSRRSRPTIDVALFLAATGFGFMVIEIALIEKFELFLGNTLTSMATVIAAFLSANALGSFLYDRIKPRIGFGTVSTAISILVVLTIAALEFLLPRRMGLSLAGKIPIAFLTMVPLGMLLGICFPIAVRRLETKQRLSAVAAGYGISSLFSVTGAVYGLIQIRQVGFRQTMEDTVYLYVGLAVIFGALFLVRTGYRFAKRA
jgi:hypothetical protein